jgi:hypothetical protein
MSVCLIPAELEVRVRFACLSVCLSLSTFHYWEAFDVFLMLFPKW